jgi:hypothetical protein
VFVTYDKHDKCKVLKSLRVRAWEEQFAHERSRNRTFVFESARPGTLTDSVREVHPPRLLLCSPSPFLHDRLITCERGTLHRADGSARWTQDSSSVLAAVYGPRQVQIRKEDAEQAVVEVVFKPRSGFQGEVHSCPECTCTWVWHAWRRISSS